MQLRSPSGRVASEQEDPATYAGHRVMFPSGWGMYTCTADDRLPCGCGAGQESRHATTETTWRSWRRATCGVSRSNAASPCGRLASIPDRPGSRPLRSVPACSTRTWCQQGDFRFKDLYLDISQRGPLINHRVSDNGGTSPPARWPHLPPDRVLGRAPYRAIDGYILELVIISARHAVVEGWTRATDAILLRRRRRLFFRRSGNTAPIGHRHLHAKIRWPPEPVAVRNHRSRSDSDERFCLRFGSRCDKTCD